jgi:hypothetical protein
LPIVPREKIDDDLSETMKLSISFDRVMLGLEAKSLLIEIICFVRLTNVKYETVMTKTE